MWFWVIEQPPLRNWLEVSLWKSRYITRRFSTHFKSVYRPSICTPIVRNDSPAFIDKLQISAALLESSITHLKENNHTGHDEIPSIFVKKCSASLPESLLILCSKSLSSGVFPFKWKDDFIFPIHKTGNKHEVNNHRSIAILSIISKIFDSIVEKLISEIFYHITANQQHASLRCRSTPSNLLVHCDFITFSIKQNRQIDYLFFILPRRSNWWITRDSRISCGILE